MTQRLPASSGHPASGRRQVFSSEASSLDHPGNHWFEQGSDCEHFAPSECAHPILPGQTWQGEWGEAGDQDFFYFPAGAGTTVHITLERVDTTLPPQHPDAPGPEILLARPDGVVFAASEPLALDATGTSLDATLTLDGLFQIVARTPKGTGAYLVTLTKTAEGGLGTPTFGWTNDRTHLTTELRPDARLQAPIFDPFGNPVSGARVSWEEGSDCGVGDFCGSGTTTTERSSVDGAAVLDVQPAPGGDPLWRPGTSLGPASKARPIRREGVAKRINLARSAEPFLGILRTSGTAVLSADLPDLVTARTITSEARQRAKTGAGDLFLKDGPLCGSHTETCSDSAPVFRAVQLSLEPGDDLVGLEVHILDGGSPTETLDGQTVLSDLSLTLEAVATVRDDQDVERQVAITDPISVAVSRGAGGAISYGAATCTTVDVTPGPFTYMVGNNAAIHQVYDEPDGSPCCWQPTEALYATVVVDAEVDDGQGGTIRITRQAETMVESIPRPADPCEVRSLQSGTPELAAYDAFNLIDVGDVYLTDACGNIVYGVGLSDSENHDQPGDEFRVISPLDPPGEGVWATALSGNNQWSWSVRLHGDVGTPDQIPNGSYTIDLEVASQSPECSSGGVISGAYTVNTTMGAPQVVLWWDADGVRGPNPDGELFSPGSALRDATTGEIAVWRVPAFNDPTVDYFFEGPYTDVPVKLYVAWYGSIPFDPDGNLDPAYLQPVEGVELCTGIIEKLTDAAGHLDWNSPVRTTCDTAWTTFATTDASSDPEDTALNPAGPPDTWVPVGLGVGVTKGPEQPGGYVLVAEPLDEAFRRGDSWKVITPYVPDGFIGFEVGGGMYLDENMQPFTDGILVGTSRQIYVKLFHEGSEDPLPVDVSFVVDGSVQSTVAVSLPRVGATSSGTSVYLGEIQLQTPAAGATKLLEDGPVVDDTGTLETSVIGQTALSHLASEVWVEVEQVLDKDDNEVTGTALDVKQMARLKIRYRIKGTEQHVSHSLTELEFTADETSQVHTDFYGGPPAAIVSVVDDEFPETIVNGFYETEWDGRDNTGDDRILLQGVYQLIADVALDQNGAGINAKTQSPVQIEVAPPHASNYGGKYPASHFDATDFTDEAAIILAALEALADGTSYERLTPLDSQTSTAADALDRIEKTDALFSFSGHSGPGTLQYYSVDEPVLDPDHISNLASTRAMSSPDFLVVYLEDMGTDVLSDVYLAVLTGCKTGLPPNDPENNIAHRMVVQGVDISIGFPDDLVDVLAKSWTSFFWPYVGQSETTSTGSLANIYNSCRVAAADMVGANPGFPQQYYDAFLNAQIYVAADVSSTEFLRPARYGNSSN